jgi:glutaredoxin
MTLAFLPLRSALPLALLAVAASLVLVAMPSQAQYKVIGANGKVTYTDREPNVGDGRVTALGARAPAEPAELDLPFELRQVASKYPVTLYTAADACDPCAAARQLLKQRGIPFSERLVVTKQDSDALVRLAGSRDVPILMVGAQSVAGLNPDVWVSYLDAAGYPRDSRLPTSYQYRPATPVVDRREPAVARGGAAPGAVAPQPPATAAPAGAGGIRF